MKKLNILFLNPRLSYPLIGGDRIKSFNLLSHLAKKHNVTLVAFYQGQKPYQDFENKIRELGVNTYVIPLNPIKAGLLAGLNFYKYPLEIGYYTQRSFKKIVDTLLSEQKFDLGISFFMRSTEYIKNYPFKKLLIAEDSRTLYQKRSYQNSRNFIQKIIRLWEYNFLLKYEPHIVNFFDMVSLVTQRDIEQMKKQNPKAKYAILTNGVALDSFKPPDDNTKRKGLIFTGKLDVYSNTMMADTIINDLFPKISKQYPDTTLTIAGARATKQLLLAQSNNIKVCSDVPDIIPYLQNAKVFLHPHDGASGIQNKVLEALACGCVVVTTQTGIQGIPAIDGRDVLIGKNHNELINLTLEVLRNNELAQRLSNNARKLMVETHSWNTIFKQMDNILEELFPEYSNINE